MKGNGRFEWYTNNKCSEKEEKKLNSTLLELVCEYSLFVFLFKIFSGKNPFSTSPSATCHFENIFHLWVTKFVAYNSIFVEKKPFVPNNNEKPRKTFSFWNMVASLGPMIVIIHNKHHYFPRFALFWNIYYHFEYLLPCFSAKKSKKKKNVDEQHKNKKKLSCPENKTLQRPWMKNEEDLCFNVLFAFIPVLYARINFWLWFSFSLATVKRMQSFVLISSSKITARCLLSSIRCWKLVFSSAFNDIFMLR